MIDTIDATFAYKILERIVQEHLPGVRPANGYTLAVTCRDIARANPGHLGARIGTYMAASGLSSALVGPKSRLALRGPATSGA